MPRTKYSSCQSLSEKKVNINPWLSLLLRCSKQQRDEAAGSRSCCVTYEFDVVLLIQQEVFYLQVPVGDKEWQEGGGEKKTTINICIDIRYLIQPLTVTPFNGKAGEVNPQRGPAVYTGHPPNVGHAG